MTPETDPVRTPENARAFIIDEHRQTYAHQLHLLEEIDDKAETVMRLSVFTATGIVVFLTYAARPDSSVQLSSVETGMVLLGAVLQLLSFYTVLKSYGVLGSPRVLDLGANLASRRGIENRGDAELYELVAAGYRKTIRRTAQTYVRISQELSFATLSLFLGALMYSIAIYLSVKL